MPRKGHEVGIDKVDNGVFVLVGAKQDDTLSDVVAKLIGDESAPALMQFLNDGLLECGTTALQDSLDHAAAILMDGELADLSREGIKDELNMFMCDAFDGLLDDVIAILVLDAFHHEIVELFDKAYLLINEHMLESLDCY